MIRTDNCNVCGELGRCAVLISRRDDGLRHEVRLCQECVSLAYAEFITDAFERNELP